MRNFHPRILVVAGLLTAFSLSTDAQTTWTAVGPFVISELNSDFSPNEGLVVVPPSGVVFPNPAGCAVASAAGLSASNRAYKTLSSLLMAAFLSGKRIRLWFSNPSSCAINRPAFVGVEVLNN